MSYLSDDISTKGQMDLLREKPTFGVGARDVTGQIHAFVEIFSNSKDEMPFIEEGKIQIWMFINKKKQCYQIAIADNGRGIPLDMVTAVFTKPHTSGKYGSSAYGCSSGLYGIGAKATLATTKRFRAISYRPQTSGEVGGYASVTTSALDITESTIIHDSIPPLSGTLVVYEPDVSIYVDIDKFIAEGPGLIIEHLQRANIFMHHVTFVFSIINTFVDESFWSQDILSALTTFEQTTAKSEIVYDSLDWPDPLKYLSESWGILGGMNWVSPKIIKTINTKDDVLGYEIRLFLPERIGNYGVTAMLNDVFIIKSDSSHMQGIYLVLKDIFGKMITDTDLHNFFMTKYRLPLCIAMDIKYRGAEFVGTTKESFRDSKFLKLFVESLYSSFNQYSDAFKLCFEYLHKNIENEYNKFMNRPIKVDNTQKLLIQLNYPSKYYPCETPNRMNAELFIVEGDSANNAKYNRDPYTQAIMTTRGKPLNAIVDCNSRKTAIQRLLKDKIWADLIKVSNIQPGNDNQDLSTLNFGKFIIMHDADPDGSHIETIWIGNFYVLNPNIVSSGMIYVSKPPLYAMYKPDNKQNKLFMFNKAALIDCRILAYRKVYDIFVRTHGGNEIKQLTDEEYRSFCYVIIDIGEQIRVLSETLNIPDFILECLLHVLRYLEPNEYGDINLNVVRDILPFDRVDYNKEAYALIISIGFTDYTVSLNSFLTTIYSNLYALLNKVGWGIFDILISTKYTDTYKQTPVSFVKLYKLFKLIDNLFITKRYKGLGKMGDDDLKSTCMDPNTRALFHINEVGDIKRIYDLLGDDTKVRSSLLSSDLLIE